MLTAGFSSVFIAQTGGIIHALYAQFCQSTFFDTIPVRFIRLFGLVIAEIIVGMSHDIIGQILLIDLVVRVAVGIEIVLSLDVALFAVGMNVLQLPRHDLSETLPHILLRGGDRVHARVGLGRQAHHDHRVGKRDSCFGEADLHRDIHA